MIRFESQVRIAYLSTQLVELITAASIWSSLARVDLVFSRIDDEGAERSTLHGFSLAADFATEGSRADELTMLHGWLVRQLAPPWAFMLGADHLRAEWDVGRSSRLVWVPPPAVVARARGG